MSLVENVVTDMHMMEDKEICHTLIEDRLDECKFENSNGWDETIPEESTSSLAESDSDSGGGWDKKIARLSQDLENICSRPSSPQQTSPLSVLEQMRTRGSVEEGHSSFAFPLEDGLDLQFCRHVKVRHEETEDSLNQSLTMICRSNSPHSLQMNCTTTTEDQVDSEIDRRRHNGRYAHRVLNQTPKNRRISMGPRIKRLIQNGIRFRVDLSGRNPENIAVSIDGNDHFLRIFCIGHPTIETVHLLQLGKEARAQTLTCNIEDGFLSIRERPKETAFLEFDGISEKYLPVMMEDETKFIVTITLFIPKELQCEDLTVKTIDATLVIKGSNQSEGSENSEAKSFRVAICLPKGTYSRTVEAWLSSDGQLIVRGQMAPTSRRMTCNF